MTQAPDKAPSPSPQAEPAPKQPQAVDANNFLASLFGGGGGFGAPQPRFQGLDAMVDKLVRKDKVIHLLSDEEPMNKYELNKGIITQKEFDAA